MDKLQSALKYVTLGWSIFPVHFMDGDACSCSKGAECQQPAKHPATKHGLDDATMDEAQVKEWWEARPYNIGVSCGPSDLYVIDVDVKHGGLETMAELMREESVPMTLVSKTGSGGNHYLYSHPGGLKNTQSKLGPGIDTRGPGGYVILPPSANAAGPYSWRRGPWDNTGKLIDITPLPAWVAAKCARNATVEHKPRPVDVRVSESQKFKRASAYLCKMDAAIEGSGGDPQTFKVAAAMVRGFELSVSDASALMISEYNPRCLPPWSPEDIERKCRIAEEKSELEWGYLLDSPSRELVAPARNEAPPEELPPMEAYEIDASATGMTDVIDEVAVEAGITTPHGFEVSEKGGIWKKLKNGDSLPVSKTPAAITASMSDAAGNVFVRLSWKRRRWEHQIVPLDVISSRAKIEKLSRHGLHVTSTTSKHLVDYLTSFYFDNEKKLPHADTAWHLGWQKGGGFLWGDKVISSDGIADIAKSDPQKWHKKTVLFAPVDDGLSELAGCFTGRGSIEEWKRAVGNVADYPIAQIALLCSFAAPLLEPLVRSGANVRNFVADFSYTTSAGKSTLLRIAASAWGNPMESEESTGIMGTWGSTKNYIERCITARNHLPTFLDDTKRARKGMVPSVTYMVANGQGDGRATIAGVQNKSRFRTILLSTGETQSVSFSQDGGTRPRTLSIWGAPFGEASEEKGQIISEIDRVLTRNYGVAGPVFIQWVQHHARQFKDFLVAYNTFEEEYRSRAKGNGPLIRQAPIFATLRLTEELMSQAGVLPWVKKETSALEAFWSGLQGVSESADRSGDALKHMQSYCHSRRSHFFSKTGRAQDMPHGGWLGRWDVDTDAKQYEFVGMFPHIVKRELESAGFEPTSIMRAWVDRGVTLGKRRSVRIDGDGTSLICFGRSVWAEDGADAGPPSGAYDGDEAAEGPAFT